MKLYIYNSYIHIILSYIYEIMYIILSYIYIYIYEIWIEINLVTEEDNGRNEL